MSPDQTLLDKIAEADIALMENAGASESGDPPPTDIDTGYWSTDNWEWPVAPDRLNWWMDNTVAGKEFKSNIESEEWKVGVGKEILNDMTGKDPYPYDEAVKRRGHLATGRRIVGDFWKAGPEVWELIKNPVQIWTDFWDVLGQAKSGDPDEQNLYEGTKTRAFQALEGMVGDEVTRAAIIPWVIAEGMVIGMAHAVWNVARGEASAGDVLDIATLLLPAAKAVTAARSMKSVARGVARSIGSGKVVSLKKKDILALMDDPDYGPPLRAKAIEIARTNKLVGRFETGAEALNLFVQNDELMLELLGYVGQRITTDTIARYKSGDIDADVDEVTDGLSDESVEGDPVEEDQETPPEDTAPIEGAPPEEVTEEVAEDEAVEGTPAEEPDAGETEEVAEEVTEDGDPAEEDPDADEELASSEQILESITYNVEAFKSNVMDAIDSESDASAEQIEEATNNIRTFVASIVDDEAADMLSTSEDPRFQGKSLEEIQEVIADEHVADLESRLSDISGSKEAFDGIVNSIAGTANEQVHLPSDIDAFVDSQDIILEDDTGSLINPNLAHHPDYADIGTDGLISSIRESARQKIGELVKTPLAFRKMAPAARDVERVEYTKSTKDGKSNYKYVYRNDEGRALASINVDQVSEDDIIVTVRTPGFKPVVARFDRDSLGDAIPSEATQTVILMGGLPQTGLEQEHDIVDDKGRTVTEVVLARALKPYTSDEEHQGPRDIQREKDIGEMPAEQDMFGTYWTIGNVKTGKGERHYTHQDWLDNFIKHIYFQDLDNFTVYARRQSAWHEAERLANDLGGERVVGQEEWSRVDRNFIEQEVRRYLEIQDNAGSLCSSNGSPSLTPAKNVKFSQWLPSPCRK